MIFIYVITNNIVNFFLTNIFMLFFFNFIFLGVF